MKIIMFAFVGAVGFIFLGLMADLLPARVRPEAKTRYSIERAEAIEQDVIDSGRVENERSLSAVVATTFTNSSAFKDGYVSVGSGSTTCILDGWGKPLQIHFKTNVATITNISPALLNKTNTILIWSMGPNGINENGLGDDLFLK